MGKLAKSIKCDHALAEQLWASGNYDARILATMAAMNGALIRLGGYRAKLTKPALAAAKRIGKIEVDHGDTSCQTPDAAAYIQKMVARSKAKT